jgi:hypothetical protein
MTIKIDIEQTSFPGDLGSKADFAATITAGGETYEFDLVEPKGFLSKSIYTIFESLKACDPQALRAIAENYEQGLSITFNDQALDDADTQDVIEICEMTRGMEF